MHSLSDLELVPVRPSERSLPSETPASSSPRKSASDKGKAHWTKKYAKKMLRRKTFHFFMAVLSLTNGLLIGIATDCSATGTACAGGVAWAMLISETIFGAAYSLEFVMNVLVYRLQYFKTFWGFFDVAFVSITIACLVLLRLPQEANEVLHLGPNTVHALTALRIFRVFRITRSISFMVDFTALWLMVTALFGAATTIAYALLLWVFIVFTFSVVGVTNFSYLGEDWGSISAAMLTLLQIATYDDWTDTVSPLLSNHPVVGLLFVGSYLTIVPFTLLPLVTAILTNHSLQTVQQDSEARRSEQKRRLAAVRDELVGILNAADTDGSGDISKQELRDLWNSTKRSRRKAKTWLQEMGELPELEEIFDFLSLNDKRKATVSRDEFLEGMLRYKRDKQGFLMNIALQHLGSIQRRVVRLEGEFEGMRREQRDIAIVNNPHLSPVLGLRQKARNEAQDRDDEQRTEKLQQRYKAKIDVRALRALFESVDRAEEGLLDESEFSWLFYDLHGRKPGLGFAQAWKKADSTGKGYINFDEFLEMMCDTEWYKKMGMTRRQKSTVFVDEASVRAKMDEEEEKQSRQLVGAISSEISGSVLKEMRWATLAGEAATRAAPQVAADVANQLAEASRQLAQDVAERMVVRVAAQVSEKQESRTDKAADRLEGYIRALSDRLDTLMRRGDDDADGQTHATFSEAPKSICLPDSACRVRWRHEASTQIDLLAHQPPSGGRPSPSPAPESGEGRRERRPSRDADAAFEVGAHAVFSPPAAPGLPSSCSAAAAPELGQGAPDTAEGGVAEGPWSALAAAQRLAAGWCGMHSAAGGGSAAPAVVVVMAGTGDAEEATA